jgi:ABC-type glycerol-3-phosphate transport system substrate-binding protein
LKRHLNTNKVIWSLVLMLLLTLSFGAMASAKTQLTFWTMWTDKAQLEVQREWAEDFGKLHPDVEVLVEPVPWGESYPKYQAAMAAGTTPDLGVLWPEFAVQIGSVGVLEPLDGLLDEVGRDNIYQNLIDVHSYGGHTWAAPHVNYNQVLFVRESWLKDIGYAVPQEPLTWEEFVDIARKMTKGDRYGIGGEIVSIARSHATDHAVAMAMGRHGLYYKDKEGNVTFDNPQTVAAVQELSDLFLKDKVMPPGSPGYTGGGEYGMLYQTDKLGMNGCSSSFYGVLAEEAPDVYEDTLILPLPTGPAGGANWISPDGIGIFANSKNKDLAKEFIKFYLQDENIRKWAKATRGLAATKSGNEDPFFEEPIFKVQRDQIEWGWGVRYNGSFVSPSDGELDGMFIFSTMMQDIVSRGMSVQDAVTKAAKAIERLPSIKK